MKIYISYDEYAKDAVKLADAIKKSGRTFKSITVITRGGLFPASILSAQLGIKLIDTYCISSYSERQIDRITVLKEPSLDTENTLFVDDLSDSGNTASFIKNKYPDAFLVCVYVKPKGKNVPDFYVREYNQDDWIVQPWETD
ncbi:MAG: xanthine phosphoribosyltransferase [Succinivibrio sp.]